MSLRDRLFSRPRLGVEVPEGERTLLLIGNPNVGKSALFNRLTGGSATVSNYPGTTVDVTRGSLVADHQAREVIDVPGAYSLEPRDAAEEVAARIVGEYPDAVALVVLDATRIERGLYLLLQVLERGMRTVVAVNMIDAARAKGIMVDTAALQHLLGVPVVSTAATTGEGTRDLVGILHKAQVADLPAVRDRVAGKTPEPPANLPGCAGCGRCR
ncbi:FeoB small GTPase domain-containing protein [Methanofollis tationis]|uniref:50S ribosome-binding GTPase n=1 Tax=Methanofollis tationis TaxID=81417 RepID=A0A7K4HPB7_9EURY|nr:FeoB small GTPase domain-containing protein [Methanofollis tationis]NVO66907.1 50S ribosome-binding GTPase [Methanofollis tationis]